jgi:signal transduction histidine kinase
VNVRHDDRTAYDAWLWGELLLFGLLAAALALFVDYPSLRESWDLPSLRLVIDTVIAISAGAVALLTGVRFKVDGRRFDLLLTAGFFAASASTVLFGIVPVLDGDRTGPVEAWAGVGGSILAGALIAAAAFARGHVASRRRAVGNVVAALVAALAALLFMAEALSADLPPVVVGPVAEPPFLLTGALALQAFLSLVALVGFGARFRKYGDDLDRWLASAGTLSLFSSLYLVFSPLLSSTTVSIGDFLRVLSYGVLLAGVWRAISAAAFGRAVAEERARVAREIHDGLAQYLFALATHASLLQSGNPRPETVEQIKQLAMTAQQEARFAVLALSSAGGTAPFGAALRRYVEFLTADGSLEVDVELDASVRLAPDEQIEVFRIVQEGLANVRKHADARHAEVSVGERNGERVVTVRDDGKGFEERQAGAGQGLRNIRQRASSIAGAASIHSLPGQGTAVEVVLRV